MEFFSGLFMVIGGWFGFGTTEVQEAVSGPVVEMVEQTDDLVEDLQQEVPKELVSDTDESETSDVVMVESEADVISEEELSDAMTGSAAPLATPVTTNIQTAMVGGGCFWCVEADLEKTSGVIGVISGYAGGSTDNPTYQNYGSGGHREVVEVTYDANQISFEDILIVTLKTTDPTDDDGTFNDRGDKYSAAFYYETAAQKTIIDNLIAEVDANGPYDRPLAIDVESRTQFWEAEDFHQDYYKGFLSRAKYEFYRNASGRSDFIKKHWGEDKSPNLPWRVESTNTTTMNDTTYPWSNYKKPDIETLRSVMEPSAFHVTQEDGTERRHTSDLDKNWERGIYVDVLSGEPLYSSRDKFDSGTGWPSFVAPITPYALTEHEDRKLFSVRTETRSAIADNHIGHVFNDGPADRGGLRYCMNGVALRFVPESEMAAEGYSDFLASL